MTGEPRIRRWPWWRHTLHVIAAVFLLVVMGLVLFFGTGAGDPLIRRVLAKRLETLTGSQVELKSISIHWTSLEATLKGIVIHGREPAGTEPLFAADEVQVGLRIDSFWGRKISLDSLQLRQPRLHVRIEKNGSTNLPLLRTQNAQKPLQENLLDLRVHKVQVENGWLLYNDVRTPVAVEGGNLHFVLDARGTPQLPEYFGELDWQTVQFATKRFVPLPMRVSAKFSLRQSGFTVEQAILDASHSHFDAHAEMRDFEHPQWTFRYRGIVNLLDIRQTLRSQETPTGHAEFRGEASLVDGKFRSQGAYSGSDVTLSYQPIFHAAGVSTRGSFRMDNDGLEVPDFLAEAFGGIVKGRVTLRFDGLLFRATTHIQDVHLAAVLPAIEHHGFPADELHWDAMLSADTVETWSKGFEHFEISAKMHWDATDTPARGHVPVEGDWDFRYRYDPGTFRITAGEFQTPSTHGTISGLLAPRDTALDLHFDTSSLESYRDFINAIREAKPNSEDEIKILSGKARWDGTIDGSSSRSIFIGQVQAENIRYEGYSFDAVDGYLTYSPDELHFERSHVQIAGLKADLDLNLELTDWSFLSQDAWSADMNLDSAPLAAVQKFLGHSYPVRGRLAGQFHGRGTRSDPILTGLFDLADGDVYGVSFNRLRGQLNLTRQDAGIANAELRVFPPGKENGRGAGIITGSAGYHFTDGSISADLVGASLPLQDFPKLQTANFPVGGQVSFRLKASGIATAPQGEGTFRVVDLEIGHSVIGSFDGKLSSDGQTARLDLSSAMTTGEISGGYTLALHDPFALEGKIRIKNIDLNPLVMAALHLKSFDGDTKADGEIALKGTLKNLDAMEIDADFSRLALNYAKVQLENYGPVRFRTSRNELQVEPATFRGTDTDFKIGGGVHFSSGRAINLKIDGALDLRLLASLVPGLNAGGRAQMNATMEGTLDVPSIKGKIHVEDASARVADFPTGLSRVKGDFVFDATRLFFDNLTAEAGGGTLRLTGSLDYAERPLRYDITARTDGVRIRYPEGMSWLANGTLRLTGTTDSGSLSGRVVVERVMLTEGLEAAGALVSTKEGISGPTSGSSFLRNLQFDIEVVSAPDARMQWPGAQLEAEANLRVRGTSEHPILLGHIHVLSGDLLFHGNRYNVARGDVNFANPFRLDPTINVEATTTIQQYEITLNFTGPVSKLTLAYRSDPPLPGNDIVTLLALGQTSSEGSVRSGGTTQTGNSTTSGASAILSEAVSSQVGGRLEKLFGITNFRVDPGLATIGSTGSEQNAAARVTVQQQVTRNLSVTYVSNVGSTQQQVIQVEFNVTRNISIVALRDYNGTFGIDVIVKKRFP